MRTRLLMLALFALALTGCSEIDASQLPLGELATAAVASIIGLLAWGLRALVQYLTTKTALSRNQWASSVVGRLDDAVIKAVRYVEQRIKPEIASVVADGKITAEEAQHLRDVAFDAARDFLGEHGWSEVKALFGGEAELAVEKTVEAAVQKVKAEAKAPVAVDPSSASAS